MSHFLIFLGALSRILPHPANFTPVTALALFGGSHLPKKQAILVPLLAMLISDVGLFILAGYPLMVWSTFFVYTSLALISILGMWLKESTTFSRFLLCSISSVALFFVVTNFGVWIADRLYPMTFGGFVDCYIAAIPFVKNSLFGDLAWMIILFGSFSLLHGKKNLIVESRVQSKPLIVAEKS